MAKRSFVIRNTDFTDDKKKGTCWRTERLAKGHVAQLQSFSFGVLKCRVFSRIRIKKFTNRWCIKPKESKTYKRWLRTGRGCD